jgi:hypothetical protein
MKLTGEKAWLDPAVPRRALMYFAVARLSFFAAFVCFFAAGIAFAQEGTPSAAPDVDVLALVKLIVDAVQNGNGWLAAGPALTLAVFLLRKYDTKIPKVGPAIDKFLNQPLVAFALPVVLSALTGLFGALATGQPIAPALLAAVKVAGTAVMTFLLAKNTAEQVKGAKAEGAKAGADPGPTLSA